jgi:hypothetical protein
MGKFRRGRKAQWGYLEVTVYKVTVYKVTVYKMGKFISDRKQMGIL